MHARRFTKLEDMMEHIISSSHGLRSEENAAEPAEKSQREAPSFNISGGQFVLAIYGNFSGPINIYRQGEEETISSSTASTPKGGVS